MDIFLQMNGDDVTVIELLKLFLTLILLIEPVFPISHLCFLNRCWSFSNCLVKNLFEPLRKTSFAYIN